MSLGNLKSLASTVAEILKGNRKILSSCPSPGPHRLFFWWDWMMGLDKLQLQAKFKVAGFIYYGNIKEVVLLDKFAFCANL